MRHPSIRIARPLVAAFLCLLLALTGCQWLRPTPLVSPTRQGAETPASDATALKDPAALTPRSGDPEAVADAARAATVGDPSSLAAAVRNDPSVSEASRRKLAEQAAADAARKLGLPDQATLSRSLLADTSEPPPVPVHSVTLAGRTHLGPATAGQGYRIQATVGTVLDSATVTLLDAGGSVLASGVTDARGAFSLTVPFAPALNGHYVLESAHGKTGEVQGNAVVRLRTILRWSGSGWLSITNSTTSGSVVLNSLTTAVALLSALDPVNVPPSATIGKVVATSDPAYLNEAVTFTNHKDDEIRAMASNLLAVLDDDLDPVESVDQLTPTLTSLSSSNAAVGTMITLAGRGFVAIPSRNYVYFQGARASVYHATATRLVVGVPAGAATGKVWVTTDLGDGVLRTTGELGFTVPTTNVTINSGTFRGSWYIPGVNTWANGPETLALNRGRTYQMVINGYFDSFMFTVGSDGKVTCDGSATGGTNTLTFNTVDVAVNPNQAQQAWSISGVTNWIYGSQTVTLLKNNRGGLTVNGLYGTNGLWGLPVRFSIDAAGNVASLDGRATGGAASLGLNVANVKFVLGAYENQWVISGFTGWRKVDETLPLVKGGRYRLNLYGASYAILFDVGTDGAVTIVPAEGVARATASGGTATPTITVATRRLNVRTNGYYGNWQLSGFFSGSGDQSFVLATNNDYRVYLWPVGWVLINFGSTGTVTIKNTYGQGLNGTFSAATGATDALNFSVAKVAIKPNGVKTYLYSPYLTVAGWTETWNGQRDQIDVFALKGTSYYVYTYANYDYMWFDVKADGSVAVQSNSTGMVTASGGTATPTLTYITGDVSVNPGNKAGIWYALYMDIESEWRVGTASVKVIKNQRWAIRLYDNESWNDWVELKDTGIVVYPGAKYVSVSGGALVWSTKTVTIKPNGYIGNYRITYAGRHTSDDPEVENYTPWVKNENAFELVTSASRRVQGYFYTYGGTNRFWIETNGSVTIDPETNFATYDAGTSALTLRTRTATITPNPSSGWYLSGVTSTTTGAATVSLVYGQQYWLLYYSADTDHWRKFGTKPSDGVPDVPSFTLNNGTSYTAN